MTVQELIDILKQQNPTDIVSVETMTGNIPVDDDWSHCHFHDGDKSEVCALCGQPGSPIHAFSLMAYGEDETGR